MAMAVRTGKSRAKAAPSRAGAASCRDYHVRFLWAELDEDEAMQRLQDNPLS